MVFVITSKKVIDIINGRWKHSHHHRNENKKIGAQLSQPLERCYFENFQKKI